MILATSHSDPAPGNYELVESAIEYFRQHQPSQPSLAEVAGTLGVSEGHLHRLFRDWTGLTPKQFLQSLTVEKAKALLKNPSTVLDTALDVGLSGASRLHDHFVTLEAMTPAEYRDQGVDLDIQFGTVPTPFGQAFVAFTDRGICQFTFTGGLDGENGEERLRRAFARARISNNQEGAIQRVAQYWRSPSAPAASLRLLVKGTNFQVQVWRALLQVERGGLVDYGTLAHSIGRPTATRAVASAVGANPVALFIPCHRVIRRDGGLGGYRWGLSRKQMLLVKEQRPD